jgi:type IV pilus assembly protein PilQ
VRSPMIVGLVWVAALSLSPGAGVEAAEAEPAEIAHTQAFEAVGPGQRISVDFKDADLRAILRAISRQCQINIIVGPEIKGTVTAKLEKVHWENALQSILGAQGYSYRMEQGIITVLAKPVAEEPEVAPVAPLVTEVIKLKYIDANDVQGTIQGMLSSRGKVAVFKKTTRAGWAVGAEEGTQREREEAEGEGLERSTILVLSDVQEVVDRIKAVIEKIDVMPMQIMIDVKVIELSTDAEEQLGIKWNILGTLKGSARPTTFPIRSKSGASGFIPRADTSTGSFAHPRGFPYVSASDFTFGTLDFQQLAVTLEVHAEDLGVNVLSNPRILVQDNRKATILVGERYPIIQSTTTDEGTVTETFDRYEPIGIQLIVIPQVLEDSNINLVIHPVVSSLGSLVQGSTALALNRINTREADTQVTVRNGQTIVIGGLMKDRETTTVTKVPLLGDIPLLGSWLFRHTATTLDKIDLLIFVTPHLVEDGKLTSAEAKRFDDLQAKLPDVHK